MSEVMNVGVMNVGQSGQHRVGCCHCAKLSGKVLTYVLTRNVNTYLKQNDGWRPLVGEPQVQG